MILNPAPATGPLPTAWFAHIDYLTPNESEAEALSGVAVTDLDSARRAGERLLQLGAGKVIITLGAQGALLVSAHGEGEGTGDYLLGIAMALGAALLYAIAALVIKRLKGVPPHLIALVQVCVGVLMLAPLADLSSLPQGTGVWSILLTLGVVHTGIMYVLLYGAIQKLPTALTGALSFIYPVAAIAVDWLVFEHRLGAQQWLGVAAILLAAAGMQQGWSLTVRGVKRA